MGCSMRKSEVFDLLEQKLYEARQALRTATSSTERCRATAQVELLIELIVAVEKMDTKKDGEMTVAERGIIE